jgi:hypothetical protein
LTGVDGAFSVVLGCPRSRRAVIRGLRARHVAAASSVVLLFA